MFAKIRINKSIYESLSYNEKKLKEGKGILLQAENFIKDADQLSWKDKTYHFNRLTSLRENYHYNCFHTSINFHPADKLSSADLRNIAREYMQQMKMGEQPYLVYRHDDAAHPHLHIISAVIRSNREVIQFSIGDFYKSQKLGQHFEQVYALTPWKSRWGKKLVSLPDGSRQDEAQKITYGQTTVQPAISAVLDKAMGQYKYTSLSEFNAILSQYNVEAYPGKEGSRLRKYRGLLYRILDAHGKPTGSQIKASDFDCRPTLARLEKQFLLHQWDSQRQQHKQNISTAIDWVLLRPVPDLPALQKALEKEKISLIIQKDRQSMQQSIFFIDRQTNAVFDSRSLDNAYQLTSLERRCAQSLPSLTQKQEQTEEQIHRIRHRL